MSRKLHASFERCCRLCAREQDVTIMLFSQEAKALHLQNKLNKYLLIEVEEDDELPKNICVECCSQLQKVCDFIDGVKKAQDELLERCTLIEQISPELITTEIKKESDDDGDDDDNDHDHNDDEKYTQMEISVDPMMVLQNEDSTSPNTSEDVTYLHGVDAENVTITKLIKRDDSEGDNGNKESHIDNDSPPPNRPYYCKPCGKSFMSEFALKNHNWIHVCQSKMDKPHKCNNCSMTFNYKYDLVSHLKQHKAAGSCQLCGRAFRSERTFLAHLAVHLPSNKEYTCKVCGRSYNTWGGLKTHAVSHSEERPHQCTYCRKRFKRNQDLKFHINQHTGEKPYKCPFCDKCFASSGNCYSHKHRMHPEKAMEAKMIVESNLEDADGKLRPKPPQLVPVNGLFKYQCSLCEHSFLKRDNYTYHMFQHTGEKPFQCSFCAAKFVTRRGLLIHHEKQHPSKDRPLALLSKNLLLK